MAALEAAASLFCLHPPPSSFSKFLSAPKFLPHIKLRSSASTPSLSLKFSLPRRFSFALCSVLQEATVDQALEQTEQRNEKRKLFVLNLPWSLSVTDIKEAFGECGTVTDVEIIKHKDGKNRGFAFVTMASAEEAQAAVDKFDSYELSGRIIRVEFAKRFRKPRPPPASPPPVRGTRYKLYVSNLAWKVRSSHLREFFSANFSPISTRVVFENPSKRSAGYGFVAFATKEEAEAAISALDGKELMGRSVCLKFSQRNNDESGNEKEEEDIIEGQSEELSVDESGNEKEEDIIEGQSEES